MADIIPGVFEVDQGIAEIKHDPFTYGAWLLLLNGAESSQMNPDDPENMGFEYMRWMAKIIRRRFEPSATERVRMLHLGGAGCTVARWVAWQYPNAHQTAVELDAKLAELARTHFGLPRAPQLKIRVGEAGHVLAGTPEARWEVIIRDVFHQPTPGAEHTTPAHLITQDMAAHAARALSPNGVYLVNYGGPADLSLARAETATIGEAFEHVSLVADPVMFKGRRQGNIIIVGSHSPLTEPDQLCRVLLADEFPAHLKMGEDVAKFRGSAQPITSVGSE